MAVEIKREGWLGLFDQMRNAPGFLQSLFTVKPGGIYSGDKVAIDVRRTGEPVAVAIKKCTGPNLNDISRFTTKEFEPPSYGEAFPMDVCDLLNRMAGVDPFSAEGISYQAQMTSIMAKGFVEVDAMIQRAVELQASQILQTAKLDLIDKDGATTYELDFKGKASHFPNAGTNWSDTANSKPLDDLFNLAKVIRSDGKINVNAAIMGETALSNFLNNSSVQSALDNRRIDIGEIAPEMSETGATFYGRVWVGTYLLELWAYPETYDHPQTGAPTNYIESDKVVLLRRGERGTRLDKTSARVPLPLGPDPRVEGLLPGRLSSAERGFDVTPNVYTTANGKQVFGELESRPLLVPVQIDGFGCLDTEV